MTMTMNTFKIQNEVFKEYKKAWSKSRYISKSDITLGKMDDNVVVVYKSAAAYIIPNSMFVLDMDKILSGTAPFTPDYLFKNAWDGKILKQQCIEVLADGREAVVLADDADIKVHINREFLKFFDDMEYVQFRGTSYKEPVYVFDTYSGEELIGCILPIRV